MIRRVHGLLPAGTVTVGGGLALLGVASYAHLAVAGHRLGEADYSSLSVLWTIVFTVGLGVFLPIEQETARLIAARRGIGLPPGPVLVRAAMVAGALLGVLVALLLGAARLIADQLFAGDIGLVWVLVGALGGLAMAYPARGLLSGLALFPWYGAQIGLDGALRIVLVGALGLAGVSSPVWYGLVLLAAPTLAVAVTAAPVLRAAGTLATSRPNSATARPPTAGPVGMGGAGGGAAVPWRPLLRGLGLLTVSSLLAQVVANIGVINMRILAPANTAAGALLSALVLVRIPLFVFASLQASLLPGLSAAASARDRAVFQDLLRRALGVVTALGLLSGVITTLLGPWLVPTLFGAPDVLARVDFAWLSVGTVAYLWAMVLGQAVLAQDRHRAQAFGWVTGTVALVAVTLLPISVTQRVEIAYAVGSAVIAASMCALLRRASRPIPVVAAPDGLAPVSGSTV